MELSIGQFSLIFSDLVHFLKLLFQIERYVLASKPLLIEWMEIFHITQLIESQLSLKLHRLNVFTKSGGAVVDLV